MQNSFKSTSVDNEQCEGIGVEVPTVTVKN